MKLLLISLLMASSGAMAFETSLTCEGQDTNYKAKLVTRVLPAMPRPVFQTKTLVYRDNILISTLKCRKDSEAPNYPDKLTTSHCDDGISDGGYSAKVTEGGVLGLTTLEIYEKSFFGTKSVAKLNCQ